MDAPPLLCAFLHPSKNFVLCLFDLLISERFCGVDASESQAQVYGEHMKFSEPRGAANSSGCRKGSSTCERGSKHLLRIGFALFLSVLASLTVCAAQEANTVDLFADIRFQHGFLLSYSDSSKGRAVESVLNFGDTNNLPVWRLCQWATKYSLGAVPCVKSDDAFTYENQAKRVVVGGLDSRNKGLTLDIRGSAEYGAKSRQSGEPWPHLLVEQDAKQMVALDALDAIRFRIRVRLLHCESRMAPRDYDPGLHAAQFQMFFIVKNIRPGLADQNNFIWFGVPFFDSRHDLPPAFMAADAGKKDATGKFIYTIGGEMLGETPLKTGQWMALDVDLLPHILKGLQEATKRGYLKDTNPHDYAVANMNMGWEIPGTFDAAVQVQDLEISAVLKESRSAAP